MRGKGQHGFGVALQREAGLGELQSGIAHLQEVV